MLFNSFSFLVFFPVVAILYYLLPHRFRWALLLVASCYFYMAFIPAYILILLYLIAIDFVMGLLIEKAQGRKRKWFLVISIIANVGTLFFFKYFNFFNANVAQLAALIHWNYSLWTLRIALPLGLSFHTFQSLAYVIEVYKGRSPAERHLGTYALYVMFFPQLVAGPIERPQQLLPQLHAEHRFDEGRITQGLRIMLWGFFKKLAVADVVGMFVNAIYGNMRAESGMMLAAATVGFAIQLYADFSGYSDIARGAAKVFGVNLVDNFDTPYFSKSIAEFWRRWHISLSNWFRDYLYQPLAFSFARMARTKAGVYVALILTFAIIGLWHGAAWTFVIFGAVFGCYMAIGLATQRFRDRLAAAVGLTRVPKLRRVLQTATTFALVAAGFVFFRAPSAKDALYILTHLGGGWSEFFRKQFWKGILLLPEEKTGLTSYQLLPLPISCIILFAGEYFTRVKRLIVPIFNQKWWARWSAYYVLILWVLAFSYHHQQTFIYFQF